MTGLTIYDGHQVLYAYVGVKLRKKCYSGANIKESVIFRIIFW